MQSQLQSHTQAQSSASLRVAGRFLQCLVLLLLPLSAALAPRAATAQAQVQTVYRYDAAGNVRSVTQTPVGSGNLPTLSTSLTFSNVPVGSSGTAQARLTNASGVAHAVPALNASAVSGDGFSFVSSDCPGTLPDGAFCSITVQFRPTLAGDARGSLKVRIASSVLETALFGKAVVPPSNAVSVSLTQSLPSTVALSPYTVSWASTNAASCKVEFSRNGEPWVLHKTTLNESQTISPAVLGSHVWRFTCIGTSGDTAQQTFTHTVLPAVSVSLTQSLSSTVAGSPYTVSWASSNAASCNVDFSRNGEPWVPHKTTLNESQTISPVVLGTHVWRFTCIGTSGDTAQQTFTHTVLPAVSVSLTQSSSSTVALSPYTVSWASTNAASCKVEFSRNGEPWVLHKTTLNESQTISPAVLGSHVWRFTCIGTSGDTAQQTFTHTVLPAVSVSLTQSLSSTVAGSPYTVSWASSNAASCNVDFSRNGEPWVPHKTTLNESQTISPVVLGTHVWRFTCIGTSGDTAQQTFTHTVLPAVSVSLTQSLSSTVAGSPYTVSWASSNAASCNVDFSRNGEPWVPHKTTLNESQTISPVVLGTHVWRFTCIGTSGDTAQQTFTHTVLPAVSVSLTQSLSSTVAGSPYTVSWASSNAASCNVDFSRNGEPWVPHKTTLNESQTISPVVLGTHVWRFTCIGTGGDTAQQTFTHTVLPAVSVSLTQSLSSTVAGSPYTVSWASSNAASCNVDFSRNGEPWVPHKTTLNESQTISPVVLGTHVWRFTCIGTSGDTAQQTFTHTVLPAV